MKENVRKLKAYTLNEIIIVLAIIGILGSVSVMSMGHWISETRMNAANADARMLFNAVQTVVQDFKTQERDKLYFKDGTSSGLHSLVDDFYMYYDSSVGEPVYTHFIYDVSDVLHLNPIPEVIGVTANFPIELNMTKSDADLVWEIQRAIFSYYSEAKQYYWGVYVKDSIVQSVVISENPNWRYVGAYPQSFWLDDVNIMRTSIGAFNYGNGYAFSFSSPSGPVADSSARGFLETLAKDYAADLVTTKEKQTATIPATSPVTVPNPRG